MSPWTRRLVILAVVALCCSLVGGQGLVIRETASCAGSFAPPVAPPTAWTLQPALQIWEAIILIMGFGLFAILFSLIHWLIRTYVYFDAHRTDTYFDAGGDASVAMVMCSFVTKWAWTASFTWSVYNTVKFGIVGHFWFCAGLAIQPLLFAIVACEIRIKAPGAKTFLQVIHARYGVPAHVVFMLFAFFVNIVIAGMVMYDGSNLLHAYLKDVKKEIITVILALSVFMFTIVSGVGGSLYASYAALVFTMGIVATFVVEVFFDPWNRQAAPLGSWKAIYQAVSCYRVDDEVENDGNSALTFLSTGGVIEGVLVILAGMSSMFVNQSFWQTSMVGKPTQAVWGYILGAFIWFAIPFGLSFALGSAYQVWVVQNGMHPMSEEDALKGLLPLIVSERLLKLTADYVMVVLITVLVVTTAGGEVLSVSSIIMYDIYQTYIAPFKKTSTGPNQDADLETHKDEYTRYDRRCMMLKHIIVTVVSVLLIPVTLVMFVMKVDTMYLFKVLGVVCGGCVLPICFSVTWHRVTGLGVALGAFAGLVSGMLGWLVYAATFRGGLADFRLNTGRWEALLAGSLLSLVVGGVVSSSVSLCCGGCDSDLAEDDEWEKTRSIDSPIMPWAVKYAPDFRSLKLKGIPHFYAVRRIFRFAELSAYIGGVIFAVLLVLLWPACMLLTNDWSEGVFVGWTLLMFVWIGLATIVAVLFPLIAEIVAVVRQAYYVRKWARSGDGDTYQLDEEVMSQPERHAGNDTASVKTAESDYMSAIDSGLDNTSTNQRWKTFIHLQ